MQDDLQAGARAGDVADVGDGDVERAPEQAAEMRDGVRQLVLLVAVGEVDEDAEVVGAW